MAFWKHVLEQLQGFDPVLEGAEDIEFEWRLLDSGHDIGYHPAALVWHYRRPGLGPYLRQQRHYGRAQAILERRYPDRFRTGHRVIEAARRLRPGREETDGTAVFAVRYLTLARPESALLDLAHQWGVPAALMLGFTAPLALVRRKLGAPAVAATTFVAVLLVTDAVLAGADLRRCERRLGFRTTFAVFRLLRPLAFRWGHLRAWHKLCASAPEWPPPPEEPPPNGRAVQP